MNTHSFLSWNVRGACSSDSRQFVRLLNESSKAVICCLQETKCTLWDSNTVKRLGMGHDPGWAEFPARGLSGGLLTVWNTAEVNISSSEVSRHWLLIRGTMISNSTRFACFNIYAPQGARDKLQLWADLSTALGLLDESYVCLLGDFNVVRSADERFGCNHSHALSDAFNSFLNSCGLADIPILNSTFTWFGPFPKKGRLDRALVSPAWFMSGDWGIQALCRKLSDHKPLLLKTSTQDWGPRPFKFFNCWLEDDTLAHTLRTSWKSSQSSNIHHKFRSLREAAKMWNSTKMGNIDIKIKEAETARDREDNGLSNPKSSTKCQFDLDKLYRIRSRMLCQRSKTSWQLYGEKNTRFFHRAIAKRRAHNTIRKIEYEQVTLTRAVEIKQAFYSHFSNLLAKEPPRMVFNLGSCSLSTLSPSQCSFLDAKFTLTEIEFALSSTEKTKAPGPDGINAGVLSLLWPEIKHEVLLFFQNFHSTGSLPQGCNSSFIALIPKVLQPMKCSEYRPISLMNALVKLLTKVLSIRLSKFMNLLVGPQQSGFIRGRQISDSILLTNEIVFMLQKKIASGMIFKIDFEKAFDRVNWDFVYEVLAKMNFSSLWINWIQQIFDSSRISILVNGSPTAEFSPKCGLRQGDPLSPLIFNLVGEVLSQLICRGEAQKIFKGISLPGCSESLTHLQFADDVILFLEGDEGSVYGIKRILQCFQLLSGLKINFSKSQLFGFHTTTSRLTNSAGVLGCQVGSLPFKYLGAMIGSSPHSISFWTPLIDKLRRKLQSFDASKVSIAGRVVLLKAVIDSVPLFWFSLYKMPSQIVNIIEQMRRNFFWGQFKDSEKKMHLLNWESICQLKSAGGQGLVPISLKNNLLLAKWVWRAYKERGCFWNNFFVQRYGKEWNYDLSKVEMSKTSPVIKSMLSVFNTSRVGPLVQRRNFKWRVRSGRRVLFWEDSWLRDEPLSVLFPCLYKKSAMRLTIVRSVVGIWLQGETGVELWAEQLSNSDLESISYITFHLQAILLDDMEDVLKWIPNQGSYSSREGFFQLGINHSSSTSSKHWNCIWAIKVPPRITAFLWKLAWAILPTKSFLSVRLKNLSALCPWCDSEVESVNHVFWECTPAIWAWDYVGQWWSLKPQLARVPKFSLHSLFSLIHKKHVSPIWRMVIAATLWTIWLTRNELIFQSKRTSRAAMKEIIFIRSSKWGLASNLMNFGDDPLWKVNPIGAINIHHHTISMSFWDFKFQNYDYICMVDGAKNVNAWGKLCCAVGGCIKNSSKQTLYCFSGQVPAFSVLEAEVMAILHVLNYIQSSKLVNKRVVVCSDSTGAINAIYRGLSDSFPLLQPDFDILQLLAGLVSIQFVPSTFNHSADQLAKDGLNRPNFHCYWASSHIDT